MYGNCRSCSLIISHVIYLDHVVWFESHRLINHKPSELDTNPPQVCARTIEISCVYTYIHTLSLQFKFYFYFGFDNDEVHFRDFSAFQWKFCYSFSLVFLPLLFFHHSQFFFFFFLLWLTIFFFTFGKIKFTIQSKRFEFSKFWECKFSKEKSFD